MKVIIAGTRTINNYNLVASIIRESKFSVHEVVSGAAKGVDRLGEAYARVHSIPVKRFPAEWNDLSRPDSVIKTLPDGREYDANAGPRRNELMAQYADALIAIRGRGESPGTDDMIRRAEAHGLKVFVFDADVDNLNDTDDAKSKGEPIMISGVVW